MTTKGCHKRRLVDGPKVILDLFVDLSKDSLFYLIVVNLCNLNSMIASHSYSFDSTVCPFCILI